MLHVAGTNIMHQHEFACDAWHKTLLLASHIANDAPKPWLMYDGNVDGGRTCSRRQAFCNPRQKASEVKETSILSSPGVVSEDTFIFEDFMAWHSAHFMRPLQQHPEKSSTREESLVSMLASHRKIAAQVRVMPQCWFILLRFWLRVDQTLVRLWETRYFCNTGLPGHQACIIRETTHSEGTFEDLRAAGAPAAGVSIFLYIFMLW